MQMTREEALAILSKHITVVPAHLLGSVPLTEWAAKYYYIPTDPPRPIHLEPHQVALLDYMFDPVNDWVTTMVYSAPKKSGKTAVAGMAARYKAEFSGPFAEVYCMANDKEQARGRIYDAALKSVQLTPGFDSSKQSLPDRWRIIERAATHLPTSSTLTAVAVDNKGAAGSNSTATFWSELWGYQTKAQKRMYSEMTNVPTRKSIRFVETYAGYKGESDILQQLWNTCTLPEQGAEQLTIDNTHIKWPFEPDDPNTGTIPIYFNKEAGIVAYIDHKARMPWQTPEYYAQEARLLTPDEYLRLHENEWSSQVSQYVPMAWWKACKASPALPPIHPSTQLVLAGDASVTGDATALSIISRHPNNPQKLALRAIHKWQPTKTNPMNYETTIEAQIRWYCANYNVASFVYDAFQLHDMSTRLHRDFVVWCKAFPQGGLRLEADKALQDMIRDRRIEHDDPYEMEQAIDQCAAKTEPNNNSKLRIIKKETASIIDPVVATSMAAYECLRLNLE